MRPAPGMQLAKEATGVPNGGTPRVSDDSKVLKVELSAQVGFFAV